MHNRGGLPGHGVSRGRGFTSLFAAAFEQHSSRPGAAALLSLSLAVGAVACSLATGADRVQCKSNADCIQRGDGTASICQQQVCTSVSPSEAELVVDGGGRDAREDDPVWGCLGNVPPSPTPDPSTPVGFYTRFQGILTASAMVDLPVKACLLSDENCVTPFATGATDAQGIAGFQLYEGFRGYLEIAPSASDPNVMPAIHFVQPVPSKAVAVSAERPPALNLVTKTEFAYLSGSVSKEVDPEYGHLFFGAVDCQGLFAAEATLRPDTIGANTFSYYTDSAGTPSLTQGKTTVSGNGGYINLPPGKIHVVLSRVNGQRVGEQDVIIRKGTISYLFIGPSP